MNKRIEKAMAYLERTQEQGMNNKGNLAAIAAGVGAFAIGLITLVLVAVIIASLMTTSAIGAQNCSSVAWCIANNTLGMLLNFSAQLGLAGTVLGFTVIFVGLALIGYYSYNKVNSR